MKKILLIEDNSDIMHINTSALRMRKFEVLQAFCLAEASDHLAKDQPDLIVMESVLPDGSGLDFCSSVKARSSIPILFLSKHGKPTDIIAGFRAGADDYLSKPCDLKVLLARIQIGLRTSM